MEFEVVEGCRKLEAMDILHGDTDWESSSDSSSSDDNEELDFLYGGQASNILSSLEESIGKIDDFLSYERGFSHGDIVRSATDPFAQMGRVVNVTMAVDVENFHGKIVRDIESKNLLKLRTINVGDHVAHGPWVGRVDRVVDRIAVLFDDGTKCEVSAIDQKKLRPISPHLLDDSPYSFYPGLRVQVGVSASSKSARWLCGSLKENQDTGTVSSVEADLVYVDWLATVLVGSDLTMTVPQRLQHAESLTIVQCFPHENWQLGDWCLVPQPDPNVFHEVFAIMKTKTVVDVEWQDGTCSLHVDTRSLAPVNAVNSHEFWPGQFVVGKGACDDSNGSSNQNWGVVIGVDAKERTVKVKWKSISMNQESNVGNDTVVETVSAYELDEHPDYSYCFGDIVLKSLNQHKDVVLNGEDCENMDGSKAFLQFIGCVAGFKDGCVKITWASGLQTKVTPDEIFRIDKSEGSATSSQDSLSSNEISEKSRNPLLESSSSFFPQSAVGFFTNIAATLLGTFTSAAKATSISSEHPMPSEIAKANDICTETQPLVSYEVQQLGDSNLKQQYEDISRKGKLISRSFSESPEQFQHFDVVDDCSDHHFLDSGKGFELSQVNRAWLKRVQREWNVLDKDLPESIYVRAYEERMDLLRAAIVGAPGTPYHNGLFFLDIQIPPQYPHEPPLVHYISGGLRVNPNLYESGKVCLSLLNTWTGTGSEVWNPASSNILQVLLSLQALVLNEKPYFNEAGFDKQIGKAEGERNSVSYNENAFLLTWKSMLYLLRRPPKHFEALLEEHLKTHSQDILSACKVYINGIPVASAPGHGQTMQENITGSSTGFKLMLAKLFPKLVQAFSARGIDCSHFTVTDK